MSVHPLIDFFILQGVPLDTIVLLLMLPIVATLVAFFRQIIGIKAFGIYTPSIVTFAFLAFDPKGIKYGIAIFLSIIITGMLSRILLKHFRLLYLPRVAITLTIVALTTLTMLVIGGSFNRTGLASVSIFPLLIMITLVEKFIATQIEKGDKTATILALETLGISLIGYAIVRYHVLIELIIAHPWVVLITLPINVWLGKWTGLRVMEYLRFRKIFDQN
ncbi:MAG: 7TM domain-containing protein [Candidatus Moranbacteria bacterium]|nr:7TM domain-containing protein [Candidatus Moranbacteria bacterium]